MIEREFIGWEVQDYVWFGRTEMEDFAVKFVGGDFLQWNDSGVFLLHFGILLAHFSHA